MRSLNRFEFIGRLGADVDMRFTPSGLAISRVSIAVQDDRYNKESQSWDERTQWFYVTFFGDKAERLAARGTKGALIFVEGKVENNEYEKDGVTVRTFQFNGWNYQILAPGKDGGPKPAQQDDDRYDLPGTEDDVPW